MARLWKLSGPRSRGTNPLNIVQAVVCVDDVTGDPVIDPATGAPVRFVLTGVDLDVTRECKRLERELAGRLALVALRDAAEAAIDQVAAGGGIVDAQTSQAEQDKLAALQAYGLVQRKLLELQLHVDTKVLPPDDADYLAAIDAVKAAKAAIEPKP